MIKEDMNLNGRGIRSMPETIKFELLKEMKTLMLASDEQLVFSVNYYCFDGYDGINFDDAIESYQVKWLTILDYQKLKANLQSDIFPFNDLYFTANEYIQLILKKA